MKIWKLKKGHDFRLRSRHPWVFSNELLDSPKSVKPGEPVEVQDIQGHFLARGYGNPHSLISFRAMTFSPKDENPTSVAFLTERLVQAWQYRNRSGFKKSFRLCFSEVDQMPGLVLDRYIILKNNIQYQVFSFQLLTSGMDLAFQEKNNWETIFKSLVEQSLKLGLSQVDWAHTLILQRNDVNVRKLEGIPVEDPKILKTVEAEDLTNVEIHVQNVMNADETISFQVNLIEGQKTGFFLDQTFNMKLLIEQLSHQKEVLRGKKIRILDLCCYMGQWSSQIVTNLKAWGIDCEVHLVDVSEMALTKAKQNIEKYGVQVFTYKKDVLNLDGMTETLFDIVISDPPAFVKNKKDIHQGLNAYFKLNSQAFKMCAPGALVVSCTCSGLVQLEDFKEALRKSVLRSGRTARCVVFGGQGWDHPTLMSFPEGYYLKMVMHQLD
ncbi:MAG: class I SAM-dependent rRNA methyltransferase [Bdellovibrionaceae bacterium]|nr:class I SAM-dependent rRNA methyltransferase [Bdellovibrio sp.]